MKTARGKTEIRQIREKILEKALAIIATKGLDGLTMRSLAKKTGMTAPNLYNFFTGKDEIYIHLVIRGFEMLDQNLRAAAALHKDAVERLRAMISAYLAFGMSHPRYYDIMFTRPTPKYNDYIGTPLEKMSAVEYKISMDIAALALDAAKEVMGPDAPEDLLTLRLVEIWSLMHGMITLNNSQVMGYVADRPENIFQKIIDEFIASLTR
ncbi:MAG: TetR/AcrR family transcriptional regulator [Desulfobacterales bacterium]